MAYIAMAPETPRPSEDTRPARTHEIQATQTYANASTRHERAHNARTHADRREVMPEGPLACAHGGPDACVAGGYIVMPYTVMTYMGMACIVMAYIAMAIWRFCSPPPAI